MAIVFVHGVNNREGDVYSENEIGRNGLLREIVAPALGLSPGSSRIFNPYWGKDGAGFAWNMAVLPNPGDRFETFGGDPQAQATRQVAGMLAESSMSGNIVADAQRDFPAALDLLFGAAISGAQTEDEARALGRAYLQGVAYAQRHAAPDWVPTATPDNFADLLMSKIEAGAGQDEQFGAGGLRDALQEGLSRLRNAAPAAASEVAVRLLRQKLNATVTRFAGDAFAYLARRGTRDAPGPIVRTVLDALREASTPQDGPLVVIAHSFGGEIMYDILTHFAPGLHVDCLVTVGSQVGLFEEMKLYLASQDNIPPDPPAGKVARPAGVQRWLNVFDTNDVFAYRLSPVVDGTDDFSYDTGLSSFSAHGGYFLRPSFYRRLALRLAEGQEP
jgi:hypothetical protein